MEPGGRAASRQVQFVLVVAADPCCGQALAQNLEAQSYLVLTAGSVREASEKLIIEPALLILDAALPDASGWDLLDWLARCGREVPVVMIAARERGLPRRMRLRPILVLPPPVALDTLVAIVQEHLLAPETAYGV
jgi:DNA-binding response OmpR family regulator